MITYKAPVWILTKKTRVQIQDIQWGLERCILALKGGSKINILMRDQIQVKDIMKKQEQVVI